MAIGAYFSPKSMNETQYNDIMKRLTAAGAASPKGRTYHSCFGTADKLMVFDVWNSQADFDAFGQTLMPILAQVGVDPGEPQIMPIVNVVKP
jgi:hypothetical protein